MTQLWGEGGAGSCQFCGQRVVCCGTWLDNHFPESHENGEWEVRDCSGCGKFRITGSAGAYSKIPEPTLLAVSSWIREKQSEVPASGWEQTDLPLVTSGLIDHLRESRSDVSRTRDEGRGDAA